MRFGTFTESELFNVCFVCGRPNVCFVCGRPHAHGEMVYDDRAKHVRNNTVNSARGFEPERLVNPWFIRKN